MLVVLLSPLALFSSPFLLLWLLISHVFPEHYKFAFLQLIPGQMFPARRSPRSARAPPLNLTSPPPQCTLCPTSQGLLPACTAHAASLQQRPNPSSCPESWLTAALCISPGLYPVKAGAPRNSARGSAKSCPCLLWKTSGWVFRTNEKRKAQMMTIIHSRFCLPLPFFSWWIKLWRGKGAKVCAKSHSGQLGKRALGAAPYIWWKCLREGVHQKRTGDWLFSYFTTFALLNLPCRLCWEKRQVYVTGACCKLLWQLEESRGGHTRINFTRKQL